MWDLKEKALAADTTLSVRASPQKAASPEKQKSPKFCRALLLKSRKARKKNRWRLSRSVPLTPTVSEEGPGPQEEKEKYLDTKTSGRSRHKSQWADSIRHQAASGRRTKFEAPRELRACTTKLPLLHLRLIPHFLSWKQTKLALSAQLRGGDCPLAAAGPADSSLATRPQPAVTAAEETWEESWWRVEPLTPPKKLEGLHRLAPGPQIYRLRLSFRI